MKRWRSNSRLDTIQAAVLRVKLKHLPRWNALRRKHAAAYDQRLAGRGDVVLPAQVEKGSEHVYHLYAIRAADRAAKLQAFEQHQVQAGIHYPFAVHRLRAYRQQAPVGRSLSESEAWADECLSLPMFPELTEQQIDHVTGHLLAGRRARAA